MSLLQIAACSALTLASVALAQDYSIPWYSIDSGGGTSTGGGYTLSGTIGQPDAGGPMTGGEYTLTGGFWAGIIESCPADFDGNGSRTVQDLLAYLSAFRNRTPSADIDANGAINVQDLLAFLSLFRAGC